MMQSIILMLVLSVVVAVAIGGLFTYAYRLGRSRRPRICGRVLEQWYDQLELIKREIAGSTSSGAAVWGSDNRLKAVEWIQDIQDGLMFQSDVVQMPEEEKAFFKSLAHLRTMQLGMIHEFCEQQSVSIDEVELCEETTVSAKEQKQTTRWFCRRRKDR